MSSSPGTQAYRLGQRVGSVYHDRADNVRVVGADVLIRVEGEVQEPHRRRVRAAAPDSRIHHGNLGNVEDFGRLGNEPFGRDTTDAAPIVDIVQPAVARAGKNRPVPRVVQSGLSQRFKEKLA
jgi:hypothetical protein